MKGVEGGKHAFLGREFGQPFWSVDLTPRAELIDPLLAAIKIWSTEMVIAP